MYIKVIFCILAFFSNFENSLQQNTKREERFNHGVERILKEMNKESTVPIILKPLGYSEMNSMKRDNRNNREPNGRPGYLRSKLTGGQVQGRNNMDDIVGLSEDGEVFSKREIMKRRLNSFRIAKLFPDVHPKNPGVRNIYFPDNVTESTTTTTSSTTEKPTTTTIPPPTKEGGGFFARMFNWWPFNKRDENTEEIITTTTPLPTTTTTTTTSLPSPPQPIISQPIGVFYYIPSSTTSSTTTTESIPTTTQPTPSTSTDKPEKSAPVGTYHFVPISALQDENTSSTTQEPISTTTTSEPTTTAEPTGTIQFVQVPPSSTSATTPQPTTTQIPDNGHELIFTPVVEPFQSNTPLKVEVSKEESESKIAQPIGNEQKLVFYSTQDEDKTPNKDTRVKFPSASEYSQNKFRFDNPYSMIRRPIVHHPPSFRSIHPPPPFLTPNIQPKPIPVKLPQPKPILPQPKPIPMKFRFENPNKSPRTEGTEEKTTIRRLPDGSIVLPNGIVVPPGFKCPLAKDK